jgi:hypothetical protein
MSQGPASELQCAENEWYVVPQPADASTMFCDTACPGDWMTVESDGLNWCFEPPKKYVPPGPEVLKRPPASSAAVPPSAATRQTPLWVFGLVAMAATMTLGAVMSGKSE